MSDESDRILVDCCNPLVKKGGSRVLCHLCQENVTNIPKLNTHLQDKHGMTINKDELHFNSLTEFNDWRKKEEVDSRANFTLFWTRNYKNGGMYKRYVCNRTGKKYTWKYKNKRSRRTKGTCKTDYHCASHITLEIKNETSLKCTYWKTHTTHENDIVFLRLPKDEELEISQKLKIGVEPEMILEEIRSNAGDEAKIKHLLSRKSLRGIAQRHGVFNQFLMNTNSALSVDLWVQKYENSNSNPILFYKKQGVEHPPFNVDDFMLIIMTESQKEMLKKYGNTLCVENTYGTDKRKFNLLTLIITDEYGEWYPAAFCISTNLEEIHVCEFFSIIRHRVGVISTKVFMSDGTATYWNAWTGVMQEIPEHFLISMWHVDEDWGEALKKVSSSKSKSYIYETLRILLKEPDELTFKELLYSFIQKIRSEPDLYDFYQYFVTYYAGRPEMWAGCYKQKCFSNTDMMTEEFHGALKQIYLGGKKTERFDKLIMKLLEIPRNKFYAQVSKLCDFRQINRFVSEINKRHRRAEAISVSDVVKMSDRIWIVQSQFIVEKKENNNGTEECNCNVICIECNQCIHSFSCTCLDFEIMNNMCEHIHSVIIYFGVKQEEINLSNLITSTIGIAASSRQTCTIIQNLNIEPVSVSTTTTSTNNMEQLVQITPVIHEMMDFMASSNRSITDSDFQIIKTSLEKVQNILTNAMKDVNL